MSPGAPSGPDPTVLRRWFEELKDRDPRLHEELSGRLRQRLEHPPVEVVGEAGPSGVSVEAAAPGVSGPSWVDRVLETIVREGRPSLFVGNDRVAAAGVEVEAASREMVERLLGASSVLEPEIRRVGRIDVGNLPGVDSYLGTGWLVDDSIVITNRHVAERIARWDGREYRFTPGRFGEPLALSLDYRHEWESTQKAVAPVHGVVWIEPDPRGPDLALLKVGAAGDGVKRGWIPLAASDARLNTEVAVIGYPARAPAHIITDQAWMERIYGGVYDVKRVAPGLIGRESRGWATHDCTTLGGNSGSVVLDMKTGEAVALHFAGLYLVENYAVPASVIRRCLRERPWQADARPPESVRGERADMPPPVPPDRPPLPAATVSVTLPVTVTVTIGAPVPVAAAGGTDAHGGAALPAGERDSGPAATVAEAAVALHRECRGEGVLAVRPGYLIEDGRLTDRECLAVAAHPERLQAVRAAVPDRFAGFPVDVRPASLQDQLQDGAVQEAPISIAYDDDARTGEAFSLDWIQEEMDLTLHVGPERSWEVLSQFLAEADRELVSSMYEFHAAHVADAIERELDDGVALKLVLGSPSRDPTRGAVGAGDFDRSETFARWEEIHRARFERIYVPTGNNGLVAKSYHIKVTVRDRETTWLSSGNWKRSSQPLIDPARRDDPAVAGQAGNREWHVVARNRTLAERFRNHIIADLARSAELGGTPEAVTDELMVDVPAQTLEAVQLEAPPARVLDPLRVSRHVRVKPLLTPDGQGAVYCQAVLQLIRSAQHQLVFQNQYISLVHAESGLPWELMQALVEKSKALKDFRIILRSGSGLRDDAQEMKRRGLDVHRCIRTLPNTHTKGIVVDGQRVLVGSHNWSPAGVTLNRDASLIFDDREIAGYYLDAFEMDWRRASPLRVDEEERTAVRLADGPAPAPGFARIPVSEFLEG